MDTGAVAKYKRFWNNSHCFQVYTISAKPSSEIYTSFGYFWAFSPRAHAVFPCTTPANISG